MPYKNTWFSKYNPKKKEENVNNRKNRVNSKRISDEYSDRMIVNMKK